MCVTWTDKWHESQEDQIAWKVVRVENGKFLSLYHPHLRSGQEYVDDGEDAGADCVYEVGTIMIDSGDYGFYLYHNKVNAIDAAKRRTILGDDLRVLKIRIPKGSKVRNGRSSIYPSINASKIDVLEEAVNVRRMAW